MCDVVFDTAERILSFKLRGTLIRLFLPDYETDFVQRRIFKNRNFWERNALAVASQFIPDNGVVIDAGGYVANHAIYFAKICHASKVYSFEPQHNVADVFERNVELNDAMKIVQLYRCALGSRFTRVRVRSVMDGTSAATSFEYSKTGNIYCQTIDSFNLSKVDFIKVDVEGMETDVLLGGKRTIDKFRPPIWVEVVDNASFHSIENLFSTMDYRFGTWLTEFDALFVPLHFVCQTNARNFDCLCRHVDTSLRHEASEWLAKKRTFSAHKRRNLL